MTSSAPIRSDIERPPSICETVRAAGYLLEAYRGRIARVNIMVWPILWRPIDAFEGGIEYLWRQTLVLVGFSVVLITLSVRRFSKTID
jgi:hypothetical protein